MEVLYCSVEMFLKVLIITYLGCTSSRSSKQQCKAQSKMAVLFALRSPVCFHPEAFSVVKVKPDVWKS